MLVLKSYGYFQSVERCLEGNCYCSLKMDFHRERIIYMIITISWKFKELNFFIWNLYITLRISCLATNFSVSCKLRKSSTKESANRSLHLIDDFYYYWILLKLYCILIVFLVHLWVVTLLKTDPARFFYLQFWKFGSCIS